MTSTAVAVADMTDDERVELDRAEAAFLAARAATAAERGSGRAHAHLEAQHIPNARTGIDISVYQGHPDFGALLGAGVAITVMRCGIVSGGRVAIDSVYLANRAAARAVGMPIGHYLFNGAIDANAAADQQWSLMDYRAGEPVVIDVEGGVGTIWNPGQVYAWAQRMLSHGVRLADLGVYMSSSTTRSGDWSAVAGLGLFLWVASYGANDGQIPGAPNIAHWSSWSVWQYTSVATWPGIAGHVDTNLIAGGFPSAPTPPIHTSGGTMTSFLAHNTSNPDQILLVTGLGDGQWRAEYLPPASDTTLPNPGILLAVVKALQPPLPIAACDDTTFSELIAATGYAYAAPIAPFKVDAAVTIDAATAKTIGAAIPAPVVDLSSLATAIASLSDQEKADTNAIQAVLAKGLSGSITIAPAK